METNYIRNGIKELYGENDDFILIGLTGRTGSGCSTAAKILASDLVNIKYSLYSGNQPSNNEERKDRIINRFMQNKWKKFYVIQVRSIITDFLLSNSKENILKFIKKESRIDSASLLSLEKYLASIPFPMEDNTLYYTEKLPEISENIKKILGSGIFSILYQTLGNNLRSSGNCFSLEQDSKKIFTIIKKINSVAKKIHQENKRKNINTFIAIDAIRSPLEAIFLSERYSSFYLMAISCDDSERVKRLKALNYSDEDIEKIDAKEGKGKDPDSTDFFKAQDIPSCIQRADIYLNNSNSSSKVEDFCNLTNQLMRIVSLMHQPGIVSPTSIERCMQIAYTAKINSGCISRQVGAVITDKDYSIKAIGWNEVPQGQVPCNLRNRFDLIASKDTDAYSQYEKNNIDFIKHISNGNGRFIPIKEMKKNSSFCFKSEFNLLKKEKNQVHTRALHAEENAFLQVTKYGGQGIAGGNLFTTASPCELCAKKAYQLAIKNIYYVDPYPGISEEHIIKSGKSSPNLILFSGIVGSAYHKLYTPLVAYKDEMNALIS